MVIRNINIYLPQNHIINTDLSREFPNYEPEKIETKIGIKNRDFVAKNETALDLAIKASEKVLEEYNKNKIDFLILCTQSPENCLPITA